VSYFTDAAKLDTKGATQIAVKKTLAGNIRKS
jgi:hypothetical protein